MQESASEDEADVPVPAGHAGPEAPQDPDHLLRELRENTVAQYSRRAYLSSMRRFVC